MDPVKAVLIDRDGTMGGGYLVDDPKDYKAYDGTKEAFELLKVKGFLPMVITNQACIARKKDNGYDFADEFRKIGAFDWFICPHDDKDNCSCRKPKTGLLEQACKKYRLIPGECFVIGDRWSDMLAGGLMGFKLILVLTGRGKESLGRDRDKWSRYEPAYVASDLKEAVAWICGN